jgi:hypothetical protein
MKYMLLLYAPDGAGPEPGSPEMSAAMHEWNAYNDALVSAGAMLAGDALQGSDSATTIRVRDGETITVDGPFAETKEVLGGYYLIDVPDLDAAIGWAEKNPIQTFGTVEIRPLLELSGADDGS